MMDISEWRDVCQPNVPKQRFLVPPALAGLAGTLILHALIVQSVYGRLHVHISLLEYQEFDQTTLIAKTNANEHLLLVQIPAGTAANRSVLLDSSEMSQLQNPNFKVPVDLEMPAVIADLALNDEEPEAPRSNIAEATDESRLFGLYSGQIQARIERAWRRPRSSVKGEATPEASEAFQCTAQIVQDTDGNVKEILLPHCNGTSQWQSSLIMAIREASPLPAPPDRKVFSRSVTLNFIAFTSGQRQPDDGSELTSDQAAIPASGH